MTHSDYKITRADIMPMAKFEKIRGEKRKELVAVKKTRRVAIGPYATFYFENYDTMWFQIHEMLRIEKGGDEQIEDELAAYNPLIPNGSELVATLMFEIDDETLRKSILGRLGGVEETIFMKFGNYEIMGAPEEDVDRTSADGKASSVQFVHFPFTAEQIEAFKSPENDIMLGIKHENYPHMTLLQPQTKAALAKDFS
ncbi:MAG: DUF3501 family protein [bacterium]